MVTKVCAGRVTPPRRAAGRPGPRKEGKEGLKATQIMIIFLILLFFPLFQKILKSSRKFHLWPYFLDTGTICILTELKTCFWFIS